MIYTASDGTQIDLASGQIVGQGKSEVVTSKEATQQKLEQYPGGFGRTALDALQQGSWTLNSALFALPDSVVKAAGRAMGVSEEEIPTFTKFFNRGEVAPKNAVERYARSIGNGIGSALPVTGVFGALARTRALTAPLTASSPITKQIAKETLDFIRNNPKAAVALDLGFGGAFGAAEQAVEEYTEPGTAQDILKATVPFAAVAGVPLAANKVIDLALKLSPTAFAMRKAREQFEGVPGAIIPKEDVVRAVQETTLNVPFIKGPMNFVGKIYGSYAAKDISKKISQSLDLVGENSTQEQLRLTNDILRFAADNGFDGRFTFNLAESTLNPFIREAYNQAIKQGISPDLRKSIAQRNIDRDKAFEELITKLTPQAQVGLQDALVLDSAQRAKTIDDVLKKIQGLEEAEKDRIKDLFDQEDSLANIGQNIRSGIMVGREALINRFRAKADELTARPFGVRRPLREEGILEEGIPSLPFYSFANGFMKKYNLDASNRFFAGEVPGPAKAIASVMRQAQQVDSDQTLERVLTNLIIEKNHPYLQTKMAEREGIIKRGMTPNTLEQDALIYANKLISLSKDGLSPPGIIRTAGGKEIQTKDLDVQVLAEAKKRIEGSAKEDIRISLPESLDLLANAQRFRGMMFSKANNDLMLGASSVEADQTRRFGDNVLKDIEDFIFGGKEWKGFSNVPGVSDAKQIYRDNFENGFDKLFPLMISSRTARGEYQMGDAEIAKKALEKRENLRSLNALFGDSPGYTANLEKALLLKAEQAGAFKDGMFDERAFLRFLSNNRNIIGDLPDSVQATLRDQLKLGQAFANQKAALMTEKETLQDLELNKLVKEVIRPDADPKELVKDALNRPADMRKLVNTVGKDPEKLQSLKRGVWEDMVGKMLDPDDPILLADFKRRYGKALNILYPTQEEQRNLSMIASLQERILAVARPTGDRSPFRTFEEKLRERVGAGVGTLESTVRAAAIRIISPVHAGVSIMTRFVARQQQGVAERILLNALVDDKYAKEFIEASSSIDTPKGFKQASKLAFGSGVFLPYILRNIPTTATMVAEEVSPEEALPYSRAPITSGAPVAPPVAPAPPPPSTPAPPASATPPRPVVPRMPEPARREPLTPAQELQQIFRQRGSVPAPQPNIAQSPSGRAVPAMPAQAGVNYQMYPALFPNDPLAPLIQQRRP